MRGTGRAGRGERGRVAARVRSLLGAEVASGDGAERDGPDQDGPDLDDTHQDDATSGGAGPVRLGLGPVRWAPERRALIALAVAVLVAGALTLWWVLSARPRNLAVHASDPVPAAVRTSGPTLAASSSPTASAMSSAGSSAVSSATAARSAAGSLVVDVAGRVRRPGVYRLAAGSRVVDALRAAGGALPGVSTTTLNLAAPLRDGQQVVVGVPGATGVGGDPAAPAGPGAPAGSTGSPGGGPVELNSATLEQLQTLPGVGPVLAQHILDWRAQHGRFTSVTQLNDVSGIGDVKFAELRGLVTV